MEKTKCRLNRRLPELYAETAPALECFRHNLYFSIICRFGANLCLCPFQTV
ncbi:hypothetical protein E4O75_02665 [Neisseria meningitidis]|uniref:Uncharacterized protein n=1 Tax=Neisseria meningitidis TaxID=487 RepID=X5EGU0_NEIME|nr:hypothetical protein NMA510612_0550 [Neisseria meningitidis]AOT30064.1 hypothetical protein AN159_10120 [Neisseria meningitidis]AVI44257.1 hypothetical protein A6J53_14340 [Neisseria meningitidis]MBG8595837.1 hypothetical protein [Neisseria meningitidis]MBG8632470.1 hypothetical protein [Neisseria meningitidis]